MKIRVISDLHGRNIWKELLDDSVDRYILLGDLVDSYNLLPQTQYENLLELLEYFTPENSIWLVGNHDLSYFGTNNWGCSGYSEELQTLIKPIVETWKKRITHFVYEQDDIYYSHAGVALIWYKKIWSQYSNFLLTENQHHIKPFWDNPFYLDMLRSDCGPLWIRPKWLDPGYANHAIQIVGHTNFSYYFHSKNMYFVDTNSQPVITGVDVIDGTVIPYRVKISQQRYHEHQFDEIKNNVQWKNKM